MRRRGFTLVELLVVIGIIAMLISILLPSLAKARSAAMKVACSANMRSIGQMFQVYAIGNKGRWPAAVRAGRNNNTTYGCGTVWPHMISPNGKSLPASDADWLFDDYDNSVGSPKAFVCPAQAQDPHIQRTYTLMGHRHWSSGWVGSCVNEVFGYVPRQGYITTVYSPSKFRSSETIMMGEMQVSAPEDDGGPAGDLRKYHMGGNNGVDMFDTLVQGFRGPWAHDLQGSNYLFCDGHVEYQPAPVRYFQGITPNYIDNKGYPGFASDGAIAFAEQFCVVKGMITPNQAGYWKNIDPH